MANGHPRQGVRFCPPPIAASASLDVRAVAPAAASRERGHPPAACPRVSTSRPPPPSIARISSWITSPRMVTCSRAAACAPSSRSVCESFCSASGGSSASSRWSGGGGAGLRAEPAIALPIAKSIKATKVTASAPTITRTQFGMDSRYQIRQSGIRLRFLRPGCQDPQGGGVVGWGRVRPVTPGPPRARSSASASRASASRASLAGRPWWGRRGGGRPPVAVVVQPGSVSALPSGAGFGRSPRRSPVVPSTASRVSVGRVPVDDRQHRPPGVHGQRRPRRQHSGQVGVRGARRGFQIARSGFDVVTRCAAECAASAGNVGISRGFVGWFESCCAHFPVSRPFAIFRVRSRNPGFLRGLRAILRTLAIVRVHLLRRGVCGLRARSSRRVPPSGQRWFMLDRRQQRRQRTELPELWILHDRAGIEQSLVTVIRGMRAGHIVSTLIDEPRGLGP